MRRCAGCGADFENSRSSTADVKNVALLAELSSGPLRSAISMPLLQQPDAIEVPGAGWRAAQTSTYQSRRKRGWRTPRDCRVGNVCSTTRLTGTLLQSQCIDPVLAEAARARVLAAKPRKPGSQPLHITPGTSPYHTKALKLLAMHSSDLPHIREEAEPQSAKSSLESVRRAKYNILPPRERSPQNRGQHKFFASLLKPDFTATFPRSPSLPSGYETYTGKCQMPDECRLDVPVGF